MKNLNKVAFGAIVMLAFGLKVNAQDVEDWASLKTCLTKETSETCTLKNAITGETDGTVLVKNSIFLELNDQTLTLKDLLRVDNGGSLTIQNSGGGIGTINGDAVNDTPLAAYEGGSITIKEKVLITKADNEENYATVAAFGGSNTTKLTIEKGAEIYGSTAVGLFPTRSGGGSASDLTVDIAGKLTGESFAVSTHGTITSGDPVINIKEGAELISNQNAAIYSAGSSKWTINTGSSITGLTGIVARRGTINIEGGKITATGEGDDICTGDAKKDGECVKLPVGAAVVVDKKSNGYTGESKVTITGGEFDTKNETPLITTDESGKTEIEVKAGATFNQTLGTEFLAAEGNLGQSEATGKVGKTYEIKTDTTTHGNITVVKKALQDEQIEVIITPDVGYELDTLTIAKNISTISLLQKTDDIVASLSGTKATFTMPAYAVKVSATFKVKPISSGSSSSSSSSTTNNNNNNNTDTTDNSQTTTDIPENPKTSNFSLVVYVGAIATLLGGATIVGAKKLKKMI